MVLMVVLKAVKLITKMRTMTHVIYIYVVVAVILAALKTPLNLLRLRQVARWATGKDVSSRGEGV